MSQSEVYDFLRRQRLMGRLQYFSCREIEDGLIAEGKFPGRVRRNVLDLLDAGYLEFEDMGFKLRRKVRIKERYAIAQSGEEGRL